MKFLGEALGVLALISFIGSLLNYLGKRYHKNWKKLFKKQADNKNFQAFDEFILKNFVRKHQFWGTMTAVFMVAHAVVQLIQYGFVWSGVLAALVMTTQVILGYLLKSKPNRKILRAHRIVALLVVIFLAIHLIHVESFAMG